MTNSPGIGHELNEPTITIEWYDFVGPDPYFNILVFGNLLDVLDQLHCHVLLPEIVPTLDHELPDSVTRDRTVGRCVFYSSLTVLPQFSEVSCRQNQALQLLGTVQWVLFGGQDPVFALDGILITDSLEHNLEGDSFLGRKSEAVLGEHTNILHSLIITMQEDSSMGTAMPLRYPLWSFMNALVILSMYWPSFSLRFTFSYFFSFSGILNSLS